MMSSIVLSTLLHCIAMVETNDNPNAVGAHGEIGRYQMMPMMAAKYTPEQLIKKIELDLENRGMEVTPFSVAFVWNHGSVYGGNLKNLDYARRVARLYEQRTR